LGDRDLLTKYVNGIVERAGTMSVGALVEVTNALRSTVGPHTGHVALIIKYLREARDLPLVMVSELEAACNVDVEGFLKNWQEADLVWSLFWMDKAITTCLHCDQDLKEEGPCTLDPAKMAKMQCCAHPVCGICEINFLKSNPQLKYKSCKACGTPYTYSTTEYQYEIDQDMEGVHEVLNNHEVKKGQQ
jgi:hypothetical protein